MTARNLLGIALLLLISAAAYGDGEFSWDRLSKSQQAILAEFRADWDNLPPKRQERLSRGAEHWMAMSDGER